MVLAKMAARRHAIIAVMLFVGDMALILSGKMIHPIMNLMVCLNVLTQGHISSNLTKVLQLSTSKDLESLDTGDDAPELKLLSCFPNVGLWFEFVENPHSTILLALARGVLEDTRKEWLPNVHLHALLNRMLELDLAGMGKYQLEASAVEEYRRKKLLRDYYKSCLGEDLCGWDPLPKYQFLEGAE